MGEKKVIYVTTLTPSEIGHGGVHRSYQIFYELEQIVGPGRVLLFTKQQLLSNTEQNKNHDQGQPKGKDQRVKQWASYRAGSAKRILKNPYRLIQRTHFATGLHPRLRDYYERQVKNLSGAVCLMEHAEFGDLIAINQKDRIPTISCTQNLEAFSQNFELLAGNLASIQPGDIEGKKRAAVYAVMMDFANELQTLAQCEERLFISKLETGLIGGLGLTARYYPYMPVGGVRNRLTALREERTTGSQDPGLFILIGTAAYAPIRKSCEWLIQQARRHGLPEGVRIIVVGLGTETLTKPGESTPGITFRGWVEQKDLDQLLVRAKAVLVPQRFGFGVPTRLAEFSCAGVPIISDPHLTYALDPPPGFHAVDPSWTNWYEKMFELGQKDLGASPEEYQNWESAQPRTLRDVVGPMLG
jgi:glycosyltransferase involved in cell wall biosynthesis